MYSNSVDVTDTFYHWAKLQIQCGTKTERLANVS